jgi:HEAT repeat protein
MHPAFMNQPVLLVHKLPLDPQQAMPLLMQQVREQQIEQLRRNQQQIRRELDIRNEALRLLTQRKLLDLIETMLKERPEFLCKKLQEGKPVERLLALQMIAKRRLPLEKEVIDALKDPDKLIRHTAHSALVYLTRGTDFGPMARATPRNLDRSIARWQNWLTLQRDAALDSPSKVAVAQNGKPANALQFALAEGQRELHTGSTPAAHLSDELVNSGGEEQRYILKRLRDARGVDNTDALAQAIPRLADIVQAEAEDALVERLTRMTEATLRDKLQDDSPEVRRAAAFACGRKFTRELIPHLLPLLDDSEGEVIQAARAVLTELTGEDFGPSRDADPRDREDAAAAWRKWWNERGSQAKEKLVAKE